MTRAADPARPEWRATFFAFRVPALPMAMLTHWAEGAQAPGATAAEVAAAVARDLERQRECLQAIAARPDVADAIAVASPDLRDALRARPEDDAAQAALVRYVSRMASRPTPFGLFAACGVGTIADRTDIDLPGRGAWRRHTRPDGDHLDRIIGERAVVLRPRLAFRPNDTLYVAGGRRRYVQTRRQEGFRTHHLAAIADSAHLEVALNAAAAGARPEVIANAVAAGGVDAPRAARYVDDLIEAQVLVPELALALTGPLPLDALIADLDAVGDAETVGSLRGLAAELAALDDGGRGADDAAARAVGLPAPHSRGRALQVDATVPECGATLAQSVVDDIARGAQLLARLAPPSPPDDLGRFKEAFLQRYESREVPLLEALDGDVGVGYDAAAWSGDPAPLLRGVPASPLERSATFGRRERRLVELLHRAWATGAEEVALDRDDIEELARDDAPPLPAAFAAIASLADTVNGPRVVLGYASGPSGASLLGRFCHTDPTLTAHVRAHLRAEEALAPDAVHAEIVHLPAGRLSNILVRPVLRDHELEWLGRSGAPPERRLPASDLLVSVRDGRVVLRSRRLGRRVLPRLTSAHAFDRRSPAVYRFLGAVQADGVARSVAWSWAPLNAAPFTPRVRWGRIVLTRACWRVGADELRALQDDGPTARWRAVQALRDRRRLPRWVCLVDADNKLAIDLDNALMVQTLVRAVAGREEAVLEELLPGPDELVARGPDGARALELVVPLVREAGAPAPPSARRPPTPPVQRTFPPGSEWTYLKLYAGSGSSETLLRDHVWPLARALTAAGTADRWFFMRYADPRPHLRVRFHGDPDALRDAVQHLAATALETGLAHDAQLATYVREIERYGGPRTIALAEQVFHADSEAVVRLLGMFSAGERGLEERWQIGVVGSDRLLCDLGMDERARAEHARAGHAAFARELGRDPAVRRGVAVRVRVEEQTVNALLDARPGDGHALAPGLAVLTERSRQVRPLAAGLADADLPLADVAGSLVHMWLNRLCRSENRRHEYVTYALLDRVYHARAARAAAKRS